MSKNHLTHADLKKQGLKLSKYEAQDLHSHINRIAQHGGDEPEVIYPGEDDEPDEKELNELTEEDFQANDAKVLARYEERKKELIELGATYSEEDGGFIAGNSFIDDDDVMAGDEDDYEETVDLVKMALEHASREGDHIYDDFMQSGKPKWQLPPAEKEHYATKKKRQKDSGVQDHIVTETDVANIPELSEQGIKVGDLIEIPIEPDK